MNVSIIDFESNHKQAFKDLNYEWISKYFEVEDSDLKMLKDPQGYILDNGGAILIALSDQEALGTCALIKMENQVFELAKMAVSPKAQGKQIGYKLGLATIEKAKKLGAKKLYLETNSVLKPAISLYRKLGFENACGYESPYSRCNVQMEMKL